MKKYILTMILLVSMIFMTPTTSTYAFSPGTHTFIAQPECTKCHTNIQQMLSEPHTTLGCTGCHARDTNTHAAKTTQCRTCHIPLTQDIHRTSYPNCAECHQDHGTLKPGFGHDNVTFFKTYSCISCHNMQG